MTPRRITRVKNIEHSNHTNKSQFYTYHLDHELLKQTFNSHTHTHIYIYIYIYVHSLPLLAGPPVAPFDREDHAGGKSYKQNREKKSEK